MENRVFIAGEDLDRIDVITSENLSINSEHLSSAGSRNLLTEKETNYRQTSESPNTHECIELSSNENILRRKSSILNDTNINNSRVPTPINMVRRWSQSISRFSKDKRSIREKTIYRLPSRSFFDVDNGELFVVDPDVELEQLVQEIEQHDYLMQTNPLSKHSRLETLRSLPQPLSVKRLLKAQLSISVVQQHSNDPQNGPLRILKLLLNLLMLLLLKLWKLLRIICNGFEIWYKELKTIEGHFGSNVSSYFKFLRWLFAFNLILFIFPLGFIMIPQILYNDDVRWRSFHENISDNVDVIQFDSKNEAVSVSGIKLWSIMDLFTGQGMLKSSLMFYGSYSNATFSYRNSKTTYSIPNAYYMTMLVLYLSFFVVISTSVARSYRISYIETSNGIRSLYASKICFAWDYSIADLKAADLKHFAIYTELKDILNELNGSKTKLSIWIRIWIYCTQTIAHLLVGAITVGAGMAIWILLKECGDTRTDESSWSSLYVATLVNLIVLVLQTVFSWISNMEDYRSPRHTLHITLARNFLLESVIIGVLIYYWITRKHVEGWETAIGQEIYRLIISDCFLNLLVLPILSCLRVFVIVRYFPKFENPKFNISLKSLGLVFNQTLLWIGLFFAPLLAGIMVIKMILLFYVNKAMLMHLCKSPRHVWRSAQTPTLYLLFSFLSLLGVIITLGYIMTQIPISRYSGPFRDQSYMFQIFIDGVLRLRQNRTIWSILMFLIRPAVVGGMLIIMSVMVYYLHAKSRAHCKMVKLLKEMIYQEAKDKEFLLTSITQITKNRDWYLKSTEVEKNSEQQTLIDSSPNWKYTRRRSRTSQQGSVVSMESATSVVSSIDECSLRNRNV